MSTMDVRGVLQIPSCPVCLETYKLDQRIPRRLSCGHSCCRVCELRLIEVKNMIMTSCHILRRVTVKNDSKTPIITFLQVHGNNFPCPICRESNAGSQVNNDIIDNLKSITTARRVNQHLMEQNAELQETVREQDTEIRRLKMKHKTPFGRWGREEDYYTPPTP